MSAGIGKGDWVQAVRATPATPYGIAAVEIGEVHRVAKVVAVPPYVLALGCRHCGEASLVNILVDADDPDIVGGRCPCGWRPLGSGLANLTARRSISETETVDA